MNRFEQDLVLNDLDDISEILDYLNTLVIGKLNEYYNSPNESGLLHDINQNLEEINIKVNSMKKVIEREV